MIRLSRRTKVGLAVACAYSLGMLARAEAPGNAAVKSSDGTAASTLSAKNPHSSRPITFRDITVLGVLLKIVDADLTDPRVNVTVQLAAGYPHNAEPVSTLLARSKPAAAVNGTYFSKENYAPIGDIVIGGQVAYRGAFKTALVVDREHHAAIERHRLEERVDWSRYETVLACGPGLVLNGKIDFEADAANHHDSHVTGRVSRMGVGITPEQHLLLVAAHGPMSFGEWANVMKELGCRDAMNLDSGASRMLYYRGSMITPGPGRFLTNLLLVYDTPPPDRTVLAPLSRSAGLTPGPPPLAEAAPGDLEAISVRICPDSNGKAGLHCPTSVDRRVKRGKVPGPCRLHRPPPGEGR